MAYAYIVGHIDIHDMETYRDYMARVPAQIAAAGGEYLVRGGDSEVLEGEFPGARSVVIRFPDRAAALAFYHSDAYAEIRAIRQAASTGALMIVDGI
jgi:uncharacterized protein (DUF1330 family)